MHMITVFDVANYFLTLEGNDEDEGITNLKMQKLCYYAQGLWLAIMHEPLFEEKIFAWQHGPVIPDLYNKLKRFGKDSIQEIEGASPISKLSAEICDFLNDVFAVFSRYSASGLRNMTHDELPWKNAIKTQTGIISNDDMKEHFSKWHSRLSESLSETIYLMNNPKTRADILSECKIEECSESLPW